VLEDDDSEELQGVDRLLQSLLNAIQARGAMAEEENKRINAVPQELVNALPYIRNWPGDSAKSCTVCMELAGEGEVLLELPCEHAFHSQCILPWLEQQHTCPTCRAEITATSVKEAGGRGGGHSKEELGQLPVKELKRRLVQKKVIEGGIASGS
jgi:E3 ubiquitin-protein ligase RNF115/126